MEKTTFTRRDIRNHTNWSHFQLKTHVMELLELEYLTCVSGGPRKKHIYQLNEMTGVNEDFALNLSNVSGRTGRNWDNPDLRRKGAEKVKLDAGRKKIKEVVNK